MHARQSDVQGRIASGTRRRRGSVVLVAVAAVGACAVGVFHYGGRTVGPVDVPTATASDPTSSAPTAAAPTPTPTDGAGRLVVPSVRQLGLRLARELPGPSTLNAAATSSQGTIAASASRFYLDGTVTVAVDNLPFTRSDIVELCSASAGDDRPADRGTHCTTSGQGWVLTSQGRPDAGNADPDARQARVWFYGTNGAKVSVWATNYVTDDARAPTSDSPVLTIQQLTSLATSVSWYG